VSFVLVVGARLLRLKKIREFSFPLDVQQFTSGFVSKEVLKVLLNYNVYATIKRPANQSANSIYLYKKGFRYELFTLIIQGNATLESGAEGIMSTVGPFSFFAPSALLGLPCDILSNTVH
jgi:hypothetical protein